MIYDSILSSEDHDYLRQIGAMHTNSIWAISRFVDAKLALFSGMYNQGEIFGAVAFDLQKSSSSVKHWFYTWRFYGEDKIAQYGGLSYSHLSWAMQYQNCFEILDWCVDNSASVDRMKAKWLNSPENEQDNLIGIENDIERLMAKLRNITHEGKEIWVAMLEDILDSLKERNVASR
jgi:hypothetical protein